jgi:hypothetical protein
VLTPSQFKVVVMEISPPGGRNTVSVQQHTRYSVRQTRHSVSQIRNTDQQTRYALRHECGKTISYGG